MNFNTHYQPYPSNRYTQVASKGMVATSQPLAANVGLDILKKGGNAVDAAIATAACLTVVEPTSNGIGSDAFALVWIKEDKHLYGINGSGFAPKEITADKIKGRGFKEMPKYGWLPVMVPGAPATWAALSERFGNLSLEDTLAPAVDYALNGYPVSPVLGYFWKKAFDKYKKLKGIEFEEWFKTFAPKSKAPKIGEIVKLKNHSETLKEIGKTNAESFYRGKIADKIDKSSKINGGYLRKEDLENYKVQLVDPISLNYNGYDICEIPPNGQGIVALMGLNILKGFDFKEKDSLDTYHKQFEAMKLAFADGKKYITDPKYMKVKSEDLLNEEYGKERRNLITNTAEDPDPGIPPSSGTVYLSTADKEGNMVSFIQSNYMGFGSGIVVEDTGIALQNRGADFSLNKEDHNYLEPGKKSYHTIIPGFIMKDGDAVGPFGVMGGYMQPQGHIQVAMNLIDFNLNPQMALDAPRWQWIEGKKFMVEPNFPKYLLKGLEEKGHQLTTSNNCDTFGRGQIIIRKGEAYFGGTESRTDGTIAMY